MQVPTTPKRGRGEHWIDKVAAGKGPDIASHITVWAERCKQMELTLKAQLPAFVLPWHRAVPLAVRIGSSGKVLFMHLLVHHVNKVVRMHFEDGAGEFGEQCMSGLRDGFFGITSVEILQHDVFNSGQDIHTVAWARANMTGSKTHAVARLWKTYGFNESKGADNMIVYRFDLSLRLEILETGERDHKKRKTTYEKRKYEKRGASAVVDPVAPVVLPLVVPVAPTVLPMAAAPALVVAPAVMAAPGSIAFIVEQSVPERIDALMRLSDALEQRAREADQRAAVQEERARSIEAMLARFAAGV